MEHPPAILEKAKRLEQLLLRVAAGEALDKVNAELGFDLTDMMLVHQQAKYEAGGARRQTIACVPRSWSRRSKRSLA